MNQLLQQLSPAESLYLLEGRSAKFQQLLKFTLFDLLLKDVLRTRTVNGEAGYLQAGPQLQNHAARPHEMPFLEFLRKYPESALEIKVLIKTIRQKLHRDFIKRLEQSATVKRHRLEGFWSRLFSSSGLNEDGLKVREALKLEVASLGKDFSLTYSQSPEKALELLKQVNGNIFLCKDVDLSILNELQQLYPKEAQVTQSTDNGGSDAMFLYAGCGGGYFDYSHHSNDLDASGCSGHGDSGCSGDGGGDSGCSSGCGGGCGGGD